MVDPRRDMTTETNPPAAVSARISETQATPRLRRVLGLGDLIFYGIVLIQPVGAVGIFGLASTYSHGHVSATIFVALIAMMLTALSYGRMAGLYPAAGSAYTYVGRGLNPHLGFLAGWAMFLDYLVIPIVSVVFGALSMRRLVDGWAPELNHQLFGHLVQKANEPQAALVVWVI